MEKSGHTRGSTVDLTLFDMATEKELDMGGTFDWFGPESHPDFCGNPETGEYTGDNSKSPVEPKRSITAEILWPKRASAVLYVRLSHVVSKGKNAASSPRFCLNFTKVSQVMAHLHNLT